MDNERAYLRKVSQFTPEELVEAVESADAQEERVLRIYLGSGQFDDIRRMGVQRAVRGGAAKLGNVVVLHGLAGGELTQFNNDGQDLIWVNILHLIAGQFDRLALNSDGLSDDDVRASGIYMRFYGSQLVSLSQQWNVRPFFYDWRRDMRDSADELDRFIRSAFGPDAPVNLVAHSMGGVVARSYIQRHNDRWAKGGRLIMLGTPNYGAFAIPRLLFGANDILTLLNKIDFSHDIPALLNIAKTFAGLYQLMPVRGKLNGLEILYRASTYTSTSIDQNVLDKIASFQNEIADVVDPARMTYIAGYNLPTPAGINDPNQLGNDSGYFFSKKGDGTVPHVLGLLPDVPAYYVEEAHQALPANKDVQAAVNDLLQSGTTTRLPSALPEGLIDQRGGAEPQGVLLAAESARRSLKEQQAVTLRNALVSRVDLNSDTVSPEEQALADLLLLHSPLPLNIATDRGTGVPAAAILEAADTSTRVAPETFSIKIPPPHVSLRVRIVIIRINQITREDVKREKPIDCIAVGHYLRVQPSGAEHDLDLAISPFYFKGELQAPPQPDTDEREDLVVKQFHERGILRGDLGVPFYLPDPRPGFEGNLLVFCGMGPAGQFGVPELSVLTRELTWSMSLLGKKHLATVLIGAAKRNLSISDCVQGWMLGLSRTLSGMVNSAAGRLEAVTFVVPMGKDTGAVIAARSALEKAKIMLADPKFNFDLQLIDLPDLQPPKETASYADSAAVRISVEFTEDGFCRYSALTNTASIPERSFHINPKRITDANRRLLETNDPSEKYRIGRFLLEFLFPPDLRSQLVGGAPVVLACNNAAARVYWEQAAQPLEDQSLDGALEQPFLGLTRGLTRQLRTLLAPPPEPPPPTGRILRILLVANGCKERPLKGADQEAHQLLDLFKAFNESGSANKVAVTALIGPSKATTLDVLLNINDQPPYDVLHYAGHCEYDEKNPINSGLLFSDGDRLTADDLDRVDRTPKFVFANACESGIMPSRPDLSSPGLPAAFAEAFFKKGVANFICTAWPISDAASRDFALELYTQLLGYKQTSIQPIFEALRIARLKISATQTWGAYQHYGNPYFRLFRKG